MYHIPSNKRSTCMFLLQPHNTLWNHYHHAHFAYEKVKADRGSLSFPKAHSLYGISEPVHLTIPHFGYVICNLLVYITGCVRAKLLQSCPTATPRTVAYQAPLSMGFSRQKKTGVGCHVLLQGILQTQGLNPHLLRLLHWQGGSFSLAPPGKLLHPCLSYN